MVGNWGLSAGCQLSETSQDNLLPRILNSPPLFFCFLGPHQWHMEVPRPLEVQSEL